METYGTTNNGKTAGIISYFTIIGWLIAYFAFHQGNKTRLGSYQLRQTLLFHIVSMILHYVLSSIIVASVLSGGGVGLGYLLNILDIVLLIFWIIGLIGAINGEEKPIPVIGPPAQNIFSSI